MFILCQAYLGNLDSEKIHKCRQSQPEKKMIKMFISTRVGRDYSVLISSKYPLEFVGKEHNS